MRAQIWNGKRSLQNVYYIFTLILAFSNAGFFSGLHNKNAETALSRNMYKPVTAGRAGGYFVLKALWGILQKELHFVGLLKKKSYAHRWSQHLNYIPAPWKCCGSLSLYTFWGVPQSIRRETSLSISPNVIQISILRFLKRWK